MSSEPSPAHNTQLLQDALQSVATAAAANIAGVDFASITVRRKDDTLDTVATTDELATDLDKVQYELHEGPCYDAVTEERFVVVNDLSAADGRYPRFGPRAVEFGVRAQAGIQLEHNGERAGVNLYAREAEAFGQSTIQLAELFSNQAAALLGYARQVGSLSEALESRQEIGTAIGILMQRYNLFQDQAFGFLVRISNDRNTKLRDIAHQVIEGTFDPTSG